MMTDFLVKFLRYFISKITFIVLFSVLSLNSFQSPLLGDFFFKSIKVCIWLHLL